MKPDNTHSPFCQAGFSLVEILVGLVIGLLTTLVIMQVFSVFEGQKRTTTGTADAQTNGNIALYSIGRDMKMAGYGLMPVTDSPLECTALNVNTAQTGVGGISPITITDGGNGAGASDTITIRYATSPTGGVPSQIVTTGVPTANDVIVANNLGCQVNDIAMILNGASSCNMTKVTALTGTTGITIQNTTGVVMGANIACLGTWNEFVYRVNPNYNPTDPNNSQAYLERNGVANITDIVNIQAQYGISAAANSNQVVQWVNATGGTWAAPTVANRNLIKAIRIAVVARNGLLEKDNVTSACSSTTTALPSGLCAWDATTALPTPVVAPFVASPAPALDLSNDPNWRRYRYRVFETIIPLRNMIWSKATL